MRVSVTRTLVGAVTSMSMPGPVNEPIVTWSTLSEAAEISLMALSPDPTPTSDRLRITTSPVPALMVMPLVPDTRTDASDPSPLSVIALVMVTPP